MQVYLPQYSALIAIDADDLAAFSSANWRVVNYGQSRYVYGRIDGEPVLFHRFLLRPPPNLVVDHIDGDGLNNRRENLRIVTQGDNCRNRRVTSGRSGIYPTDGGWNAACRFNGRYIVLGKYADAELAQAAWNFFHDATSSIRSGRHIIPYEHFDPLLLSYTARKVIYELRSA